MIFNANGANISRASLTGGVESYYEVKGNTITAFSLDRKQAQSVQFRLEGQQLVVIDGAKVTRYDRLSDPQ